jgi:hypothetical protein
MTRNPDKSAVKATQQITEDRLKKVANTLQHAHRIADKVHKKAEQLHLGAVAARERAQDAHKRAQATRKSPKKIH